MKSFVTCCGTRLRRGRQFLTLTLAIVLILGLDLQAQTFSVIHTFTGSRDGASPQAGLAVDFAGNLYGTTSVGGLGYGGVFKMARRNSQWVFTPLYNFAGGLDGATPIAPVTIGPDGRLYGTTVNGGYGGNCTIQGCGTVYSLAPPSTPCATTTCMWIKKSIYFFSPTAPDGRNPRGALVFDQAGNIDGTTYLSANPYGGGTVFQLSKIGGTWTENILHVFTQGEGYSPWAGPVLDGGGNLYGTTTNGGLGGGIVYELTQDGSGWTESVLHQFNYSEDGFTPYAGVTLDQDGNVYGATSQGGVLLGGTVFSLSPSAGGWNLSLLYNFTGFGTGPWGSLVMDNAGNLYGTTVGQGAYGYGSVFKLTRQGETWTFSSLYDFKGEADGAAPYSSLVFDASGNLYGTTSAGGSGACSPSGCGVVFQITP